MSKLSELCDEVTNHMALHRLWNDILKIARVSKVMEAALISECYCTISLNCVENISPCDPHKALGEVERILSE
jgi:hypothetical protein